MAFEFLSWGFNNDIVLKVILSVLLGGIVGLERQMKHKPAGFRTNILVALGATMFATAALSINSDSRILAGIVTGIGFIGAGSIIASHGHVKGLTTAASLWISAAIGLSIGINQYELAILGTIVAFIVLKFKIIDDKISSFGSNKKKIRK